MIGKNIQKFRKAGGLTLNVLSERCGVSKAMLSQIESDKVNPTVATVWKISKGLGVNLNDLLNVGPADERVFVVNPTDPGRTDRGQASGVRIQMLTPLSMAEDLEMYTVTLPPGGALPSKPHLAGTQEFLTVLEGEAKVSAGENNAVLKAGDFLVYHCDIEHTIANDSAKRAVLHMVVRYPSKK